jgi:chitodextrinase
MSRSILSRRAPSRLAALAIAFVLLAAPGLAGAQPAVVRADPTNANVTLKWSAVAGATSYTVYKATAPGVGPGTTGLPGFTSHTGITGTSFTSPAPLANGTPHFFVVTATGGGGESAPSYEVASIPSATVDAAKAGAIAAFAQVAAVVNAQGTSLSSVHLSPLFDAAYLNDGMNAALSAKFLAADLRGATLGTLTVDYVDHYDEALRVISVGGTVPVNGQPEAVGGLEDGQLFTFHSADGGATWKPYGNQRKARTQLQAEMRLELYRDSTVGPAQRLNVDIEAPVGTVASVTVSGPGIAAPYPMLPATVRVDPVEGEPGVLTPVQRDAFFHVFAPTTVLRAGDTWTFAVTMTPAAGGATVVYAVRYLDAIVSDTGGGAVYITYPTGHLLANAALGSPLTVSWTLPTAYPVSDLFAQAWVHTAGNAFECRVESGSFPTTATFTTLTIPATCNGQPVESAGVGVMARGPFGERSYTMFSFIGAARAGLALPSVTISLDGATADWIGAAPLATDAPGDALRSYTGGTLAGSDIRALYAAGDADHLYIRLDLWDAFNASFGNGPAPNRGSYRFRIESDSATYPVLDLGVAFGVYEVQPGYGQWVLGYNGANGTAPVGLQGASYVAVNGSVLELRIPRAMIGSPANIYRIMAFVTDCCAPEGFSILDAVAIGGAGDTTPPTAPTGLTAQAAGSTRVALAWTASADDVGVASYVVFRDAVPIANPVALSGTTFVDSGLAPGTSHSYVVVACDAAGNCSQPSAPAVATPRASRGDANGDGKSDLFWRTAAQGTGLSWWTMDGASATAANYHDVDAAWQVADVGDLDGDGKADLVWRRASDGATYLWALDGFAFKGFADLGVLSPAAWSLVGAADLDGNGKDDIVWRGVDGTVYAWLMDGGTIASQGVISNPGVVWVIADLADMDGDGKTDIVFRNSSDGGIYVYFMNGLAIASGGYVGAVDPAVWTLAGAADFSGDGKADFLWRHTSGDTWVWLMDGASFVSAGGIGNPGTSWSVRAFGDFDGDGKADLVWRHTDGTTYLWRMNGLAVTAFEPVANPGGAWDVVAP